jgi:hypothetical protein
VVVTVLACWVGYEWNWIHQRRQYRKFQEDTRVSRRVMLDPGSIPFLEKRPAPALLGMFGEHGYALVETWVGGRDSASLTGSDRDCIRQARRLFPEAEIWVVNQRESVAGSHTWEIWEGPAP